MTRSNRPFALPAHLPPALSRVRDYWESLKRHENNMPFWDDVNLSALPELSDRLMLVDAFEDPQRFRLNSLGRKIQDQYGVNVTGKFVDKIDVATPFEFFVAPASATIEARAPTFFHHAPETGSGQQQHGYARLLLPMWGNGRIEMMLGAIAAAA
jgi:hypothetical protein